VTLGISAVTVVVDMSRCESKIFCLCAEAIGNNKEPITSQYAREFRKSSWALFSFVVNSIFLIRTCKRRTTSVISAVPDVQPDSKS
jgi:hypothetical protein